MNKKNKKGNQNKQKKQILILKKLGFLHPWS